MQEGTGKRPRSHSANTAPLLTPLLSAWLARTDPCNAVRFDDCISSLHQTEFPSRTLFDSCKAPP